MKSPPTGWWRSGGAAPSQAAESGRATWLLADVQEARQVERTATPMACSKRVARPLTLPCRGGGEGRAVLKGTKGVQPEKLRAALVAEEQLCPVLYRWKRLLLPSHPKRWSARRSQESDGWGRLQRDRRHVIIKLLIQSAPRKSINPPSIAGGFGFMFFDNFPPLNFYLAAQVPLCCAVSAD